MTDLIRIDHPWNESESVSIILPSNIGEVVNSTKRDKEISELVSQFDELRKSYNEDITKLRQSYSPQFNTILGKLRELNNNKYS